MDWQFAATALVLTFAVAYIAYALTAPFRGSKKGCAGGCGCAKTAEPAPTSASLQDLQLRRR